MGLRALSFVPALFPEPEKMEYTASVYRVETQRYNSRAFLRCPAADGESFNAVAYLPSDTDVNKGDTIRFTGKAYVYDNDTSSPAQRYFLYRGISASFYLDDTQVTVVDARGSSFKTQFRKHVADYIYSTYSPVTSSIIMALYFGNRDYIDKEILHLFTYAGALHVLAASGLHVGIIACLPLLIGWAARLGRKTTWMLCMVTVWTYLYCTDMPVSLIRAAVMLGIAVLHIIGNQQKNTFNILFIAAIVILIIFPYEIFNPGFHLSFAATYGIILLYPIISRRLPSLPLGVHNAMGVTIAAQVFVVPLLIVHMGEYNISSFISNITIVPGVSLLLISSLVQPVFAFIPPVAGALAWAIDLLTSGIVHGTRILSSLGAHGTVNGNLAAIAAGYGALFIPFLPGIKKKKQRLAIMLAALLISFSLMCHQQQPHRVTGAFIHGNNGNNTILLSADGTGIIYGLPDNYRGIEKINTHFRNRCVSNVHLYIPRTGYQQIRQAGYVLKKLPVRSVIIDSRFSFSFFFKKLCKMAEEDGSELQVLNLRKLRKLRKLQELQAGGVSLRNLSTDTITSPDHESIVTLCSAITPDEISGLIIL